MLGNYCLIYWHALDKWLFGDDFEVIMLVTPETYYVQTCLWEIGVVERDSVQGKDGLDKIIEAD